MRGKTPPKRRIDAKQQRGYPRRFGLAAWFHHHPDELRRTLSPEHAAEICRAKACGSAADQL
ncbi:MAG TPA: hypothetical protein VMY37_00475 [Thermoguttaceae bacterium]|nr:hypothetical protein [Thermoguttaceae bacterium]